MTNRKKIEGKGINYNAVFILPMISINHKKLPNNFINSYINDNYEIILVFDNEILKTNEQLANRFMHYVEFMKGSNNFVKMDVNEEETVLFFNIEGEDIETTFENQRNYDLYKEGKYSQFTEAHKKSIVNFHGTEVKKDSYTVYPYDVIYPRSEKKRQIVERLFDPKDKRIGDKIIEEVGEVLDKPDLDKETYKSIEQLKETIKESTNNEQLL